METYQDQAVEVHGIEPRPNGYYLHVISCHVHGMMTPRELISDIEQQRPHWIITIPRTEWRP